MQKEIVYVIEAQNPDTNEYGFIGVKKDFAVAEQIVKDALIQDMIETEDQIVDIIKTADNLVAEYSYNGCLANYKITPYEV